MYGPQSPPPKDASITFTGGVDDGQIGLAGGKVFTFTNIQLSASTTVYWCMLEHAIKLSLNDEIYSGPEILAFAPGESFLTSGVLVWRGSTTIYIASPDNAYITAYSKFVITVTEKITGNPISLSDPAALGLDASIGGVMEVTDQAMIYDVRMEMFASTSSSGPWEPHLDFYDSRQTMGVNAWSSFQYGFYWVNDPPELDVLTTLNVDEGDSASISVSVLRAIDAETPGDELVFTIDPNNETAPYHGIVKKAGVLMASGINFLQESVTLGEIEYIHDGSETMQDSIPLRLTDGDGKNINLSGESFFYLLVNITPVNDPPVLVENNEITIEEGASFILSSSDLMTSDAEGSAPNITYTLDPEGNSEYPDNGLLKLSGVPLLDGGTFTQEDINSGNVVYEHDGSGSLTDGFVFQVADESGHLAEETGNSIFFFQIAVTPVNDDPHITSSIPLDVNEGSTKIITNILLAAADEESGPDQVIFILDPDGIMDQPNHGTVNLDGQPLNDGQSFTQEDINQSKLSYTHDGSETLNDFFGFSVSDGLGGIANDNGFTLFQFRIDVNPVNDLPFVANPIPDQSVSELSALDFIFAENTFDDPDVDDFISSYESSTVGGTEPEWLIFDPETRHFTGVPDLGTHGDYDIVVTARDSSFAIATDTFRLTVNYAVNVEILEQRLEFSVFPNPANENVTIQMHLNEKQDIYLSLSALDGKLVLRENHPAILGEANIPLNISGLAPGIYQLNIKTRDGLIQKRILKH